MTAFLWLACTSSFWFLKFTSEFGKSLPLSARLDSVSSSPFLHVAHVSREKGISNRGSRPTHSCREKRPEKRLW